MNNLILPITLSRHYVKDREEGTYLRVMHLVPKLFSDRIREKDWAPQYFGYTDHLVMSLVFPVNPPNLIFLSDAIPSVHWLGQVRCYRKNEGLMYYIPKHIWVPSADLVDRNNPYRTRGVVSEVPFGIMSKTQSAFVLDIESITTEMLMRKA